jgi:hypothetical protein
MIPLIIISNMCGRIKRMLQDRARTETALKFYKVITAFTLLYGSECGAITKQESQSEAAEMRFLRAVAGNGLTHHIIKQTRKNEVYLIPQIK